MIENIDRLDRYFASMGVDFDMREHRDDPKIATEGEGPSTTSSLTLTSISEAVGEFIMPSRSTSTTTDIAIGFIIVTFEFLHS